ncbi:hypothetical protein GSI_09991 [Ganoderma sinense ZZ0214-1]|uniref:Plant heme peroxidase family profile domain-containing protein n=1 Tax=Ganoderma sinense ZZ0214-1 TaxID=1077348 RepID=A0A2G8S265_9APHY|nr:hypothetical protein GSI_09991 [Ganoderma sinense ZZ0214-1]
MTLPRILVATLLPAAALAANNWTEACHTGECQWDLHSTHASGTMLLSGSNSSISDLTPAGGWTIIDCNATAADQEIRVVCSDASKCDHLNLNGAENTVVRLPDDCSSEPFAVVTRVWNHTDQSIPASRRSLLERRGVPQRPVQGISLSTDFAAINVSQHGNITVSVVGSSTPGIASSAILSRQTTKTGSISLPDTTFETNLFNDSFSCPQSGDIPGFDGSIVVDLKGAVSGSLDYVVTYDTILSIPELSTVNLTVDFGAALDGTLSVNADLVGSFTTGEVALYTVSLPGLDFGSIFQLGPTFTIYGEADATLDTTLVMDVDLAYTISGGELVYPPPSSQAPGGIFSPGSSNIKLSANPNVTANATLVAHLIPTIAFGVSVLGYTSAIYLDLDAHAELDLALTGAAAGSVSTGLGGGNTTTTGTGTGGGCVDISTGLAVDVGADVDLVIFKIGENVTLFSHTWDLYKTCFGDDNANGKRGYYPGRSRRARASSAEVLGLGSEPVEDEGSRALARRTIVPRSGDGFACSTVLLGDLVSLVSEIVDAAR